MSRLRGAKVQHYLETASDLPFFLMKKLSRDEKKGFGEAKSDIPCAFKKNLEPVRST